MVYLDHGRPQGASEGGKLYNGRRNTLLFEVLGDQLLFRPFLDMVFKIGFIHGQLNNYTPHSIHKMFLKASCKC